MCANQRAAIAVTYMGRGLLNALSFAPLFENRKQVRRLKAEIRKGRRCRPDKPRLWPNERKIVGLIVGRR